MSMSQYYVVHGIICNFACILMLHILSGKPSMCFQVLPWHECNKYVFGVFQYFLKMVPLNLDS